MKSLMLHVYGVIIICIDDITENDISILYTIHLGFKTKLQGWQTSLWKLSNRVRKAQKKKRCDYSLPIFNMEQFGYTSMNID